MIKVASRPFLGKEKYKVRINEMYLYEPKEE